MRAFYMTLSGLLLTNIARAATISINVNLPGNNPNNIPSGIVSNFYQFALMIGAVLAFGAIVWGGIKYTMSGGNPSVQSEGKDWVKAALLGLLLLLGAYLILYTINPALTSLCIPTLTNNGTGSGCGG